MTTVAFETKTQLTPMGYCQMLEAEIEKLKLVNETFISDIKQANIKIDLANQFADDLRENISNLYKIIEDIKPKAKARAKDTTTD